jgi:hypothetical protein
VLQKALGRVLLEVEARADRTARVDEQTKLERQIGLTPEIYDRLHRLMIIEKIEIVLREVADEFSVLVGRDEKYVDFIHTLADGQYRILRIIADI